MLGIWTRFGEGEPPADGEALVFVLARHDDMDSLLYGGYRSVEAAIHRSGMLHCQDGVVITPPHGCWWTSLPPFQARQ